MTHHIEVWFDGAWHPWCDIDSRYELGTGADEQCRNITDAYERGIHLVCLHTSMEEGQAMVAFMKERRPHIELRCVEGTCPLWNREQQYDSNERTTYD